MRALDTMASFAAEKNSQIDLKKFVVAGASKVSMLLNQLKCYGPTLFAYSNILYVHITILLVMYCNIARLDHMDHWCS